MEPPSGRAATVRGRAASVSIHGWERTVPGALDPDDGGQQLLLGKMLLERGLITPDQLRELGRGGMGVVYEALDTQLNRKVALKLMLSNPNADPRERALEEERFVQEAQRSAKLKHPHIVTVYEAVLLEGRQFLSMEMIEGQAFNDWRKTVTIRDQIKVLADVCGAV